MWNQHITAKKFGVAIATRFTPAHLWCIDDLQDIYGENYTKQHQQNCTKHHQKNEWKVKTLLCALI